MLFYRRAPPLAPPFGIGRFFPPFAAGFDALEPDCKRAAFLFASFAFFFSFAARMALSRCFCRIYKKNIKSCCKIMLEFTKNKILILKPFGHFFLGSPKNCATFFWIKICKKNFCM